MRILFIPLEGKSVSYSPELHKNLIAKFLVWEELIITSRDWEHKRLLSRARRSLGFSEVPFPRDLVGAGTCNVYGLNTHPGQVTRWSSLGYELTTPIDQRSRILQALGLREARGHYAPE
jgi:hypothetical protein